MSTHEKVVEFVERFVDDIRTLLKAKSLLDRIWIDVGPYRQGEISEKTMQDVRDFYQFDDGE